MTCSRCNSATPNSSCFVCAEPEHDEPDAFHAFKDHAFSLEQELDRLDYLGRPDPEFITEH